MKIVQIPLLKDNYGYLVICEKTNKAGIVDPSEGEPVWRRVQEEGVELIAILNTHHHRDHTGGNEYLLRQKPELEVFGAKVDEDRIPGITHTLKEGDEVQVGEERGSVLFIPGHTRGHIAFVFPGRLFSGDALFTGGCGRVRAAAPSATAGCRRRCARWLPLCWSCACCNRPWSCRRWCRRSPSSAS